jgi:hypothetical protein
MSDLQEAARRVRQYITPEELLADAARQLRRTANLYAKNLATLKEMDEAVEGWLLVRERKGD